MLAIADQTAGPNWMEFLLTLYLEPLDDEAHGGELTAPVANQLVTEGTREHLNNQSNPIKKLNQIKYPSFRFRKLIIFIFGLSVNVTRAFIAPETIKKL